MSTYKVNVTREGKWWMVAIPALGGLTQARRLSDAGRMAQEWIAVTKDLEVDDVEVEVTVERVNDIEVGEIVADIKRQRERAAFIEAEARERVAGLAARLAAADVPVRDIGTMLGVSFQRAHQLVTAGQNIY